MSKSQVDRLGDRLRNQNLLDADLRLLDQYREFFSPAYDVVAGSIRHQLGLEPTGRPAKSTTSITEKLRRESIRLTQIQDISGCRLIVNEIPDQERVVASLVEIFPSSTVVDRRKSPSHGYRAIHVIAKVEEKVVEIQVRTALQHAWAELSEKLSDLIDPSVKYGGGNDEVRSFLSEASAMVARYEQLELEVIVPRQRIKELLLSGNKTDKFEEIIHLQSEVDSELITVKQDALEILRKAADNWTSTKREN